MAEPHRRVVIDRVLAALNEGRYAEASFECRQLAGFDGDLDVRAAWSDAAELLDRMAEGKPVAAFMHGHESRLPDELRGPLVERLANELELVGQSLLAMAAFDWLDTSSFVVAERHRLARELDSRVVEDQRERVRALAQRIVEYFREAAEAGDVRALRASARALIDLGRPKEALACVRRALEREPGHLATRLSEADLLSQLGERDARRALLVELAAEFPTSAAVMLRLARDFAANAETEAGALAEATFWYIQALEREFDESVVLEFARLLERTGHVGEAIAQLEAGHERTRDPLWREDFARELVRVQRDRGQLQQAQHWTKEVERQVGIRERGYAIAAIGLMIILFGVLLVFALLSS
jgi:tetratricopeptide (TPR) repeat protein